MTSATSNYGSAPPMWAPPRFTCSWIRPEKLEAVEAVSPPALRKGQFKVPDALIASLFEPVATEQVKKAPS